MEANNRTLPKWFERVESGQLRLPRFQRYEAWDHKDVAELIESVLRGLPFGIALVLTVGDSEKFVSRPLVGAPVPVESPNEQLLDGQQRLTALWRAFNDNYDDRTFLVGSEADDENGDGEQPKVLGISRWHSTNGVKYPLWADATKEIYARGLIPLRLLRPGDLLKEVNEWCTEAAQGDFDAREELKDRIIRLREVVTSANLPLLALEPKTPKGVALDVFIRMNTSAVQLSAFDIVVAQFEGATGTSLHDLVSSITEKVPHASHYADPSAWALAVAALRENRPPSGASYLNLNLPALMDSWNDISAGIAFAVECLQEERVFDGERLPSLPVLYVLAAVHQFVPAALDGRGAAKTILRKYMWRAFLTRRYESSTNLRALQDYRGLRETLTQGAPPIKVPIFDTEETPLPSREELKRARWPKMKDILGRGILAVTLKHGALDLADGSIVAASNVGSRHYHHLFPEALLKNDGQIDWGIYRALNCALISWNTNLSISAKEPLKYLRERVEPAVLGETEVRARLKSHLIPYDQLNVGGYSAIAEAHERSARVTADYEAFLDARADLVMAAIRELCLLPGEDWDLSAADSPTPAL